MNYKEHTRLDLVAGGNVFKQGDHMTLGFTPRDYEGDVVDLTGKDIEGVIYSRRKGIMFTAPADYVTAEQKIEFTIDEVLDHGEFQIEFTVTDAADPEYRRKFPSAEQDGRLIIKPSADNMDVVGVQMTTVSQLKNELQGLQSDFESSIVPQVDELKQRVDDGVGAFTEDTEVLDARMGEPNLRAFNEKLSTQLAETVKKDDTGILDLNIFDEPTRAALQGLEPGQINAVLGIGNVQQENTAFLKPGKNLFNKDDLLVGKLISPTTGALVDSAGYSTTKKRAGTPGTNYTQSRKNVFSFYDIAGDFISAVATNGTDYTTPRTVTAPANTATWQVSVANGEAATYQVEVGTVATAYEPFKLEIDKFKLGSTAETELRNKINETIIVDPTRIQGVTLGKNLFDKTKAAVGKLVSSSNGTLSDNAQYSTTDFIEVEGSTQHATKYMRTMAFYDENKAFISGFNDGLYPQDYLFTTPANARFVRISYLTTNADTMQVEKGSKATSYEPYQFAIKGLANDVDITRSLVNIPSTIHALTGSNSKIYFENIMSKPKEKDIDVTCAVGRHMERFFEHDFAAVETRPVSLSAYKNGQLVANKNANFSVKAPSTVTGVKKAVFIGDSTTAQNGYTQKLLDLFAADASADIELIGTRGTAPNSHEGRSGWKSSDYTTLSTLGGVPNAFWNPNTSAFDFSYYMAQNGYSGLTHAFLHLGINDVFGFLDDPALVAGVPGILSRFEAMIDSVKTHDPAIKRCVMLTIPPTNSQDRFGTYYGAGQTQWRYKRNYDYFVSELIKQFDNRAGEGIYTVATNVCYDVTTDINDAVHPNAAGYDKMGEQVYKFLKVVG